MILGLLCLAAGCCATHGRDAQPGPIVQPGLVNGWYRVARVIDGDTIVLANVGSVRLLGVDTPELDEAPHPLGHPSPTPEASPSAQF